MKSVLSSNIVKLIFVAAFLFAFNQNIVQNLWLSIQNEKAVNLSEQTISIKNNDELQCNNTKKSGLFGLNIKTKEPMTFCIQLGQLQLTLSTDM